MSMAAGVIIAKAKSMYGKQLGKEQYEELLHKKSVAEIAGYLKSETHFSQALKDVRENNIHRGQLENILRREIFKQTMKLYRYADSSQKKYYQLHMQQIEIELILSRIRVLVSQEFENAIAEFPIFLKAYTSFDMLRLGNVRTYDELLDVVKKTMYYETLLPFRVAKGNESVINYTAVETALQKQYYTHTFKTIDKVLKGRMKSSVKEFFITEVDLSNITKIYRFKKFFNAREDVIRNSLISVQGHKLDHHMEELIAENSADGVIKKLKHTRYHMTFADKEDVFIEHYTDKILYDLAKKNFYYTQDGPLVFTSYFLLLSRELENIINIIEGVRYKVSSEDIEKMLIY